MTSSHSLRERLQRAQSWMDAAARCAPDQRHEAFIFLWIAFNGLYGRRRDEGGEAEIGLDLQAFVQKLVRLDERDRQRGHDRLAKALQACRKDCAVLIRDRFLVEDFWNSPQSSAELQRRLNRDATQALEGLEAGRSGEFLTLVFLRVAVLRSQILHGSATYGPRSYGRGSLTKGLRVLRTLLPVCVQLIRAHGHEVAWDPVPYPRTGPDTRARSMSTAS